MRELLDDIRDAMRSLRKQPRFLLTGALTLALGIGSVHTFLFEAGLYVMNSDGSDPRRLVRRIARGRLRVPDCVTNASIFVT